MTGFKPDSSVPPMPLRLILLLLLWAGNASAQWVADLRTGNVVHLLRSDRVERYDLTGKSWEATAPLPRTGATAFHHDGSSIFIAYGKAIYRYSADYTGEQFLFNATPAGTAVVSLARDGDVLVLVGGLALNSEIETRSLTTGALIQRVNLHITATCARIDVAARRAAALGEGNVRFLHWRGPGDGTPGTFYYPGNDIFYTSAAGNLERNLWLSDDGSRMLVPPGTAITQPANVFLSRLPSPVRAADFDGNLAVIATDIGLFPLDANFQPTGHLAFSTRYKGLHLHGGSAFLFRAADSVAPIEVVEQPLAGIIFPTPAAGVAGIGANNPPQSVIRDRDGILLMHREGSSLVSRWSPVTSAFLPGINLRGGASYIEYCPDSHRVFAIYSDGTIRVLDAVPGAPELGFTTQYYKPDSLCICDGKPLTLFSGDRRLYSPEGVPLKVTTHRQQQIKAEWDPVRQRLYGDWLKMETLEPSGTVTSTIDSPDSVNLSNRGHLIRISPDGEWIFSLNRIYSADGLGEAALMGRRAFDYAWRDGSTWVISESRYADALWDGSSRLLTIETLSDGTSAVQEWTGTGFRPGPARGLVPGSAVSLQPVPGGFLALTSSSSQLHVTRLGPDLVPDLTQPPIPPAPPPAPGIAAVNRRPTQIDLVWNSGPVASYRLSHATALDPPPVEPGYGPYTTLTFASTARSTTISGLTPGKEHIFRLEGLDATGGVLWTKTATSSTLSHVDHPMGFPHNLRSGRTDATGITLDWDDNAVNETSFQIVRTNPDTTTVTYSAPAGATSFRITGLTPSTLYRFTIQPYHNAIAGDLSSKLSVTTLASDGIPYAPRIDRILVSGGVVTVGCTDVSNDEGYLLERSLDTEPRTWIEVGRNARNVTLFQDQPADPAQRYAYRIFAVNEHGRSVPSPSAECEVVLGPADGNFTGITRRAFGKRYFSLKYPSRIEVYDFDARAWLPPVETAEPARSIAADQSGLAALEGVTVTSFGPSGDDRRELHASAFRSDTLFLMDGHVHVEGRPTSASPSLVKVPRNGGDVSALATTTSTFGQGGFYRTEYVDGSRRIFGQKYNSLGKLDFGSGAAPPVWTSKSHYDSYGAKVFLSPDEQWMLTQGGQRYLTSNFSYAGAPVAALDDVAFDRHGSFIARRGNRLDFHAPDFALRGSISLTTTPSAIDIHGGELFVFYPVTSETNGLRVEILPLSTATAVTHLLDAVEPVPGVPALVQRSLEVTNGGTSALQGLHLRVCGLPAGMALVNGVALGDGSYEIFIPGNLAAGATMSVVLQFFGGPAGDFSPVVTILPASQSATTPPVQSVVGSAPFKWIVPSVPGRRYLIEYSGGLGGWDSSPVIITAAGSSFEWIDRGPPWTDLPPAGASARFYRAVEIE